MPVLKRKSGGLNSTQDPGPGSGTASDVFCIQGLTGHPPTDSHAPSHTNHRGTDHNDTCKVRASCGPGARPGAVRWKERQPKMRRLPSRKG